MLVLSRKRNEKIVLTDRATGRVLAEIVLTELNERKARIGITSPEDVRILRAELFKAA